MATDIYTYKQYYIVSFRNVSKMTRTCIQQMLQERKIKQRKPNQKPKGNLVEKGLRKNDTENWGLLNVFRNPESGRPEPWHQIPESGNPKIIIHG